MIRTPLNLEILMHVYAVAQPIPRLNAPAVSEGIDYLLRQKMIVCDPVPEDSSGSGFKTTPRAEAYISHILKIPFPVETWVIPSVDTETN